MPNLPALYKAPGVPQRVPGFWEALGPVTLKGAAHAWSMSYAPEAPPAGNTESDMDVLPPAGLHDPAEGVAFALWNEGRKDEAIEFLERRIVREREAGGGHMAPPRGHTAFRFVGAGALAVVLVAGGAALWANWGDAAGYFAKMAIVQSQADAEAREDPLPGVAGEDIQPAADLAEVPPVEDGTISDGPVPDPAPARAEGSADAQERALGAASQASPDPTQNSAVRAEARPRPEADVAEVSAVEPDPEPEAGAELAQASTDAPQPESEAPLDHLHIAAALQAGAQMAAAEVEAQSASPAQTVANAADPAEPAPPVHEARLPRPRPESAPAMAEAPARPAVMAMAENSPPVEAPPPIVTVHPEPYPPLVLEPALLPAELAYNRARAERYLAMRRAMAERRAAERAYLVPPPQYGQLEIIGRVPGW